MCVASAPHISFYCYVKNGIAQHFNSDTNYRSGDRVLEERTFFLCFANNVTATPVEIW